MTGPKLSILYIHDLPRLSKGNYRLFADDTANYDFSWRVDTIVDRLQYIANKQLKFFERWKIKINLDKTEAIIFTRRKPQLLDTITVFHQRLYWVNAVLLLGVHLDSKLTSLVI